MQRLAAILRVLLAALVFVWPVTAFSASYLSLDGLQVRPLLTTADDPANHVVVPPSPYDGVAKVIVSFGGVAFGGSAALLQPGGRLFLLTAAHVIHYNNLLPTDFTAYFPGLATPFKATSFYLHPNWTGNFLDGYDVALVKLQSPVPTTGYDILRSEITADLPGNLAGYGRSGTGNQGGVLPWGTLRQGYNTFGEVFWGIPGYPYAYDFDNGLYMQNSILSFYGFNSDYGLGNDEVLIAPGDSGGPTFINGRIAGIHSFGVTAGYPYDIDEILNASFGEFGGDTRMAEVAAWIDTVVVPLPGSLLLVGSGLLVLFRLHRRS